MDDIIQPGSWVNDATGVPGAYRPGRGVLAEIPCVTDGKLECPNHFGIVHAPGVQPEPSRRLGWETINAR